MKGGPKSSLRSFLHRALHICIYILSTVLNKNISVVFEKV